MTKDLFAEDLFVMDLFTVDLFTMDLCAEDLSVVDLLRATSSRAPRPYRPWHRFGDVYVGRRSRELRVLLIHGVGLVMETSGSVLAMSSACSSFVASV